MDSRQYPDKKWQSRWTQHNPVRLWLLHAPKRHVPLRKLRRRTALRRKLADLLSSAPSVRNARRPPWSSPRRQPLAHQPRHLQLGELYPLLLKTNRGQIRDPDLVSRPEFHPSQAGALRTPAAIRPPGSSFVNFELSAAPSFYRASVRTGEGASTLEATGRVVQWPSPLQLLRPRQHREHLCPRSSTI